MRFEARIHVTLKPAVNDPQGNAVLHGLHSLGFTTVSQAHVGRYLTLELDADNEAAARTQVDDMCGKLLANPVIESYDAQVSAA